MFHAPPHISSKTLWPLSLWTKSVAPFAPSMPHSLMPPFVPLVPPFANRYMTPFPVLSSLSGSPSAIRWRDSARTICWPCHSSSSVNPIKYSLNCFSHSSYVVTLMGGQMYFSFCSSYIWQFKYLFLGWKNAISSLLYLHSNQ